MDNDQETRLKRVEECTDELTRAVKGHNGEPGIQTNLALVQRDIATIKNNDIPTLKERLSKEITEVETGLKAELLLVETRITAEVKKLERSDTRLRDIFKNFIWPILLPLIITGIILATGFGQAVTP